MAQPVPLPWFSVRRRRVSLTGQLKRSDGTSAGAGQVWASPPGALPEPTAAPWSAAEPPPFERKAVVRPDGLYFFLDLPPGRWVLSGADRSGAKLEPRTVDVQPPVYTQKPTMLATDLFVDAGAAAESGKAAP